MELPYSKAKLLRICTMSITSLLTNAETRRLFEQFLEFGHPNDKSSVKRRLECYDSCTLIIQSRHLIQTDILNDIIERCPTPKWERDVTDAVRKHSQNNKNVEIFKLLIILKLKCVSDIECSQIYNKFKLQLIKKYIRKVHEGYRKRTNIKKLIKRNYKVTLELKKYFN